MGGSLQTYDANVTFTSEAWELIYDSARKAERIIEIQNRLEGLVKEVVGRLADVEKAQKAILALDDEFSMDFAGEVGKLDVREQLLASMTEIKGYGWISEGVLDFTEHLIYPAATVECPANPRLEEGATLKLVAYKPATREAHFDRGYFHPDDHWHEGDPEFFALFKGTLPEDGETGPLTLTAELRKD